MDYDEINRVLDECNYDIKLAAERLQASKEITVRFVMFDKNNISITSKFNKNHEGLTMIEYLTAQYDPESKFYKIFLDSQFK